MTMVSQDRATPRLRVGIVCGSRSDLPVMEKAVALLDELGVASELRVISAHRAPELCARWAATAADRGLEVLIAGAGGAAHLAGVVAARTLLPVIGVPIPTPLMGGLDSLLSTVQMPRGVPVATVAVGGAENGALLAVEIMALHDDALRAGLAAWRARMTAAIEADQSNAVRLPG
jgi:5-(carboxyamino)imidazole ribonucleotide mutase